LRRRQARAAGAAGAADSGARRDAAGSEALVRMDDYRKDPFEGLTFSRGASLGKARCEAGWSWAPPPLPDYDLWYAVSGQGSMRIGGRTFTVKPGVCFLFRPGDEPQAEQDLEQRLTVIFIHFRVSHREDVLPPEIPLMCNEIHDTVYFERLLNRILEIEHRQAPWRGPEFDGLMKLALLELLRSREQPRNGLNANQERMIGEVIRFIRTHVGRRIDYRELAAEVNLSPQYLSVLFKKGTGVSLKEFITRERLKRAMHLLTETKMNVTEVAEALGYANVYLFSKQFKQHYAAPPSHYRMKEVSAKPHNRPRPRTEK
jgi:AraC-like DNA-binding protein